MTTRGVGRLHGILPPVPRGHSVWRELYKVSAAASEVKPRTWPQDYEIIPQTRNDDVIEPMSDAPLWELRTETFHRLHKFPDSCEPRYVREIRAFTL